ncbi:TPA: hypothetical protein DEO28_02670 [Candidatus Dependentiae bacterium]|nr:MAG: RNA methyltransferase, TrmH family, group 3 [candidate division TM6 bacterium GW2011_GWE2_31_21]KKP53189.1 MAG: RNA methyltransferase, TrmH family, group 3 [candidate division TM6 bacterium GW2011_GWF2_33_332]HBS48007.1 hypothetical protein [Candidatus Dependentiae bacterium]HBZ73389.1 hypothetical protein [Candidatus Dependentiae bacterium]
MSKTESKKPKYDLIYGPHAIGEMLKAKKRKLISIYTTKPLPKSWERIKKYLPQSIPNIQYISKDALTRMAGSDDHNGIIALTTPARFASKMFNPKERPFILLLDAIQDVRNLGAILRSAYCVGITSVVLCRKGGAELTPAVYKTSAGLAEYLDIYFAPSINFAVNEIKNAGYNLYLAVLQNGKNALEVEYKKPACLVIGNEEVGISKEAQKSGSLITLPQSRADVSFNASVAAGILMFNIFNKMK